MIKYVERKHIDDLKWNACIDNAFNGNLYGYSWFLDIVTDTWDALVENDYERVFPLAFKRKLGISYIYQPFFTQQLGLYSTSKLDDAAITTFINNIPQKFKKVSLNLNTHNRVNEREFRIIPQLNHELDLIPSYGKIRDGYSENLLRNLKKADKAGLSISKNIKPDDIITLFRENRGKNIAHIRERDYQRIKRIAYTGMYKGLANIQGVYDSENQLVAGAFFLTSNNKAIFLFSGLSDKGRNDAAMPFLIDQYIKCHAGQHLTFDFDGSNNPDLARFYKSFGSKECWYQRLEINNLPFLLASGERLYDLLKNSKFQIPNSK